MAERNNGDSNLERVLRDAASDLALAAFTRSAGSRAATRRLPSNQRPKGAVRGFTNDRLAAAEARRDARRQAALDAERS